MGVTLFTQNQPSPIDKTTRNKQTSLFSMVMKGLPPNAQGVGSFELEQQGYLAVIQPMVRLNIATKNHQGFSEERIFTTSALANATETMQANRTHLLPSQAEVWYRRLFRGEEMAVLTAPATVSPYASRFRTCSKLTRPN